MAETTLDSLPKEQPSSMSRGLNPHDVSNQQFADSTQTSSQTSQIATKPYKRRPKLPKRKRQLTEVCDVSQFTSESTYDDFLSLGEDTHHDLAILYHAFKHSKRLIAVVGAGISVAAGIPDFRSQGGLFQTLKADLKLKSTGKAMFDASVYQDEKSILNFQSTIHDLHRLCHESRPTEFHMLLSRTSEEGRLLRVYSQNIDDLEAHLPGLDTNVPLKKPWPKTIQLHGSINHMVCSKCHWCGPFNAALFKESGGDIPECPECKEMDSVRVVAGKRAQGIGKLRPRIVLYNDINADSEAIGAVTEMDLKSKPDALVIVGTTLKIPGVRRIMKEMAQAVHAANGPVIWVNKEDLAEPLSNQFEGCFDMFVKGDCQALPRLLELYQYHQQKIAEQKAYKKQEARNRAEKKRKAQKLLDFPVVRPSAFYGQKTEVKVKPKPELKPELESESKTVGHMYADRPSSDLFSGSFGVIDFSQIKNPNTFDLYPETNHGHHTVLPDLGTSDQIASLQGGVTGNPSPGAALQRTASRGPGSPESTPM